MVLISQRTLYSLRRHHRTGLGLTRVGFYLGRPFIIAPSGIRGTRTDALLSELWSL